MSSLIPEFDQLISILRQAGTNFDKLRYRVNPLNNIRCYPDSIISVIRIYMFIIFFLTILILPIALKDKVELVHRTLMRLRCQLQTDRQEIRQLAKILQ